MEGFQRPTARINADQWRFGLRRGDRITHRKGLYSLACWMVGVPLAVVLCGCGTTRTSHSSRTATEQLLISDAIDRAVNRINFTVLQGEAVYLDSTHLNNVQDRDYLISVLRQHLLASGAILKDSRSDADIIVEARAGAVGTGSSELLYGVPAINLPSVGPLAAMPASLPEIPVLKRTDQQAVAKIAVFAYEQATGEAVWQSGEALESTDSHNLWVAGAGPFQTGTLYDGNSKKVKLQLAPNPVTWAARLFKKRPPSDRQAVAEIAVIHERHFRAPNRIFATGPATDSPAEVASAGGSVRPALEGEEANRTATPLPPIEIAARPLPPGAPPATDAGTETGTDSAPPGTDGAPGGEP